MVRDPLRSHDAGGDTPPAAVLARPKLKLAAAKVEALQEFILVDGIEVHDARYAGQLPDVSDQPFANTFKFEPSA